jgi:hypothetical protein
VSLDAQAELIFAADANDTPAAEFEFTLSSADATIAGPRGFSDLVGNYTSVVTPRAANPVFDVQACLITAMANGAPVPGVMCGSQTLGGSGELIFAGEFTAFEGSPRAAIGGGRLRLRMDAEGKFTVLEAVGSTARSGSAVIAECFPFPSAPKVTNITVRNTTNSSFTRGVQLPDLLAGRFIGFQLLGTTVSLTDEIQPDCSVVTRTTNSEQAGIVQILSIERDAQGVPATLVLGDGSASHEGRLVRQP